MRNNIFFKLGMLAMVLVLGMTIVSCDEADDDTTPPSTPTGLTGDAVSSSSVSLSWDAVSNANSYRIQYKEKAVSSWQDKEGITTTSTTITGLFGATEYEFRVAAYNGYVSSYSLPITIKTSDHETASVSLLIYTSKYSASGQISVTLQLSDKAYWKLDNATNDIVKSWVTMSGTPNVSTWTFGYQNIIDPNKLVLLYNTNSAVGSISGLTAALDTSKLSEMKGYTNVVNNLTAGTPSSVSTSTWDYEQQ